MAGLQGTLTTSAQFALSASAKTVLQLIAGSNHGLGVLDVVLGQTGTAEVRIQIIRQTDAGTMTSRTPQKIPGTRSETLEATGQENATAEPSTGAVLWTMNMRETATLSFASDKPMPLGGGERLGIVAIAPSGTPSIEATIRFEE